jgi:anti-anti-sigma factor
VEFSSRSFADVVVAAPAGRIDHEASGPFEQALAPLLQRAPAGLILDFAHVDYISSVGLRVLMLAAKQVKEQRGEMVIAGMQPVVREIFEISRFNFLFGSFSTVREAIAKLSPAAQAAFDGV